MLALSEFFLGDNDHVLRTPKKLLNDDSVDVEGVVWVLVVEGPFVAEGFRVLEHIVHPDLGNRVDILLSGQLEFDDAGAPKTTREWEQRDRRERLGRL